MSHQKTKRKSGSSRFDLVIDIAGVGPQRRLGDLTVEQFVQLLVLVSAQIRARARARAQDPRVIESVVGRIRGQLKNKPLTTKNAIGKRVLDSQLAIIQGIPGVMKRAYASDQRGHSK